MKRSFALLSAVLCFSLSDVHAEADTLRIAMGEAEARMLRANVQLLAQRLAAAETQALVRQAAAWTNPSLAVEQNVYNQYTHRWLDTGPRGNTDIQIQQSFPFPGKRSSQVRMAELNAEAASYETDDLSRALRLALRTGMYDLFFLRRSLAFYDESIAAMGPTVSAMERVYEHRAVLLAELLRLKSLSSPCRRNGSELSVGLPRHKKRSPFSSVTLPPCRGRTIPSSISTPSRPSGWIRSIVKMR